MKTGSFTVEVHDVAPTTIEACQKICAALDRIGVPQPSLLVVPRYEDDHGARFDLRDHPAVAEWLRARQAAGSELIQHGLSHRAEMPPPPGIGHWLMHHLFARGRAEFAHLSTEQATARLWVGAHILQTCGLPTQGFIAPAWQQSPGSLQALRRAKYRFTAFFNKVLSLTGRGRTIKTAVLTFDAPNLAVAWPKSVLMGGIQRLCSSAGVVRVALHPADLQFPAYLDHILGCIRKLSRQRQLISYRRWLS